MQKYWSLCTSVFLAGYPIASLQMNCCHGSRMSTSLSAKETSAIFEAKCKYIDGSNRVLLVKDAHWTGFYDSKWKNYVSTMVSKRGKKKMHCRNRWCPSSVNVGKLNWPKLHTSIAFTMGGAGSEGGKTWSVGGGEGVTWQRRRKNIFLRNLQLSRQIHSQF